MSYSACYPSPIGTLTMVSDGNVLTGLWLTNPPSGLEPWEDLPVFTETRRWLDAYFRGDAPSPQPLPLSPSGTEFQQMVWNILLAIPYGQTRTYGSIAKEVAHRMGKEKMSAQAVGGAVGKNPISIIIPCHRCMGAGGALTGFRDGLDLKIWLLNHEKEYPHDDQ